MEVGQIFCDKCGMRYTESSSPTPPPPPPPAPDQKGTAVVSLVILFVVSACVIIGVLFEIANHKPVIAPTPTPRLTQSSAPKQTSTPTAKPANIQTPRPTNSQRLYLPSEFSKKIFDDIDNDNFDVVLLQQKYSVGSMAFCIVQATPYGVASSGTGQFSLVVEITNETTDEIIVDDYDFTFITDGGMNEFEKAKTIYDSVKSSNISFPFSVKANSTARVAFWYDVPEYAKKAFFVYSNIWDYGSRNGKSIIYEYDY